MKNEDIIALAITRMADAIEADRDNRLEAQDDLENIVGRQMTSSRPCSAMR